MMDGTVGADSPTLGRTTMRDHGLPILSGVKKKLDGLSADRKGKTQEQLKQLVGATVVRDV